MSEFITKDEMVKKRDDTLDIMKGICIIFVVLGHTYTPLFSRFVYLFHVAVFFMLSGYCFNEKYLESWDGIKNLIRKRLLSLWLPYVSWNFIFLLFQNLFLKLGLITDNIHYFDLNPITNYGFVEYLPLTSFPKTIIKSFFFINCRPFVGGLWFLGGLFYVTIVYCFIEFVLYRFKIEKFHIVVSILMLCLGYYINKKGLLNFLGITKQIVIILETEFLFTIGFLIKKWKLSQDISIIKQLVLLMTSFILLVVLMFFGTISVASNIITNPLYFIIVSLLGWSFVWSVSKLINISKLKCFFIFCGNKTIPILALHTLAFKLISLLQFFLYKTNDLVVIALFPVYKNTFGWALLYVIVGISIPLLISFLLSRFKIINKLFRM